MALIVTICINKVMINHDCLILGFEDSAWNSSDICYMIAVASAQVSVFFHYVCTRKTIAFNDNLIIF